METRQELIQAFDYEQREKELEVCTIRELLEIIPSTEDFIKKLKAFLIEMILDNDLDRG